MANYLEEGKRCGGVFDNYKERNIHVWCSQFSDSLKNRKRSPGVVGGCYKRIEDSLPIQVFYEWIDIIIAGTTDSTVQYWLYKIESDPTKLQSDIEMKIPEGEPLDRNSQADMVPGNYGVWRSIGRSKTHTAFWAQLRDPQLERRAPTAAARTPAGDLTPRTHRRAGLRKEVRERDMGCVVTGVAAVQRSRGCDWTGLQGAHIFPLHGVGKEEWMGHMDQTSDVFKLIQNNEEADKARNTILLRSDIHAFFDDYQWGVLVIGKKYHIIRFELNGAPPLDGHKELDLGIRSRTLQPDTKVEEGPSPLLFKEHLRTCVLWHFRGVGIRVKARSKV